MEFTEATGRPAVIAPLGGVERALKGTGGTTIIASQSPAQSERRSAKHRSTRLDVRPLRNTQAAPSELLERHGFAGIFAGIRIRARVVSIESVRETIDRSNRVRHPRERAADVAELRRTALRGG